MVDFDIAFSHCAHFEGFRARAYLCPSGVLTIGYGETHNVQWGDVWTRGKAEQNLRARLESIVVRLSKTIPGWAQLTDGQQTALVCFADNVGANFYRAVGYDTITKALRAKDFSSVPAAFLLYCNPGTDAEDGLKRRREAEIKIWQTTNTETKMQPLKFPQRPDGSTFILDVPYNTQIDNSPNKGQGSGARQCNATCAAMLAKYLKPKLWAEYTDFANGFLDALGPFGDTTDHSAITRALDSLGIASYFSYTASANDISHALYCGTPVLFGRKYKASGHMCLAIGRTDEGFYLHDPYGKSSGEDWLEIGGDAGATDFGSFDWFNRVVFDMGAENGWARFVTGVDGAPTGVRLNM